MTSVPDIGDVAPDFELPSTHGPVRLSETLREGCTLLVFYPKDDTLVCTRQLCNYRDNLSDFEDLGVQIIALNDDDLATHISFAQKYQFPFPLASDPDRTVCDRYGCLTGRVKTRRELVVIGDDGRIWWRHKELRIFHRPASELVRVVRELQGHA